MTDLGSVYSSCLEPVSGLVADTVVSDKTDAVDARKPSFRPATTTPQSVSATATRKCKGKVKPVWTLVIVIAPLTRVRLATSSALQSRREPMHFSA